MATDNLGHETSSVDGGVKRDSKSCLISGCHYCIEGIEPVVAIQTRDRPGFQKRTYICHGCLTACLHVLEGNT